MPITDIERIRKFSQKCGATVPERIIQRLEKFGSTIDEAKKVGIEVATEQCRDLMEHGIHYLHFYTLNQSEIVSQIVKNLNLQSRGPRASKNPSLLKMRS
jgi:methylenetetrahydrofolate reductase (NADPH)